MLHSFMGMQARVCRVLCGIHSITFRKSVISARGQSSKVTGTTRTFRRLKSHYCRNMSLQKVIEVLYQIAPLHLAEEWDNVGLLVEPTKPNQVTNILLTNDLVNAVMQEAIEKKVQLIVSYHPPIFVPLKSLTTKSWKAKLITQCIEHNIAVYSPHTALDAVQGGVNDWLIECLNLAEVTPIKPSIASSLEIPTHCVEAIVRSDLDISALLPDRLQATPFIMRGIDGNQLVRLHVKCKDIGDVIKLLSQKLGGTLSSIAVNKLEVLPDVHVGVGRLCKLKEPATLQRLIDQVKSHLGLQTLRLALAPQQSLDTVVSSIAVCAGSGASVLRGVAADVYLTGEMSHHELLDAIHADSTVILCEHSNTERGYLQRLAQRLANSIPGVTVTTSTADKDPVIFV